MINNCKMTFDTIKNFSFKEERKHKIGRHYFVNKKDIYCLKIASGNICDWSWACENVHGDEIFFEFLLTRAWLTRVNYLWILNFYYFYKILWIKRLLCIRHKQTLLITHEAHFLKFRMMQHNLNLEEKFLSFEKSISI